MKRKIGIIIAAIAAMGGIALWVLPANEAHAATWCSVEQTHDGEAEYKRCAHIIRIDHANDTETLTLQSTYNTTTNTTKKISEWCGQSDTYAENCKKVIDKVVDYTYAQNNASQYASGKDAFVNNVWSEIKKGTSHIDPCKSSIGTSAENYCLYQGSGNKNWMYYTTSEQAQNYYNSLSGNTNTSPSPSGGGDSGSDDGGSSTSRSSDDTGVNSGDCTSILPSAWCDKDGNDKNGDGMLQIVKFVVGVMTGAVIVAGTVGVVICGVMMVTARDNETQLANAKRRLFEIVIGVLAWGLISILINFFIPQTEEDTEDIVGIETVISKEKEA